jgi:mannose-6-phosphate isomerase-like protein (cupin superfamily)
MSSPEVSYSEPRERVISTDEDGWDHSRPGFSIRWLVEKREERGYATLQVHVHGEHPAKRMGSNTTRTYFVTRGQGTFVLDGQSREVKEGDFVEILPNGEYSYFSEDMELLETNISPDNSFEDEKI